MVTKSQAEIETFGLRTIEVIVKPFGGSERFSSLSRFRSYQIIGGCQTDSEDFFRGFTIPLLVIYYDIYISITK